eukprot:4873983-Pleurochrysis_carterae.AAC.2
MNGFIREGGRGGREGEGSGGARRSLRNDNRWMWRGARITASRNAAPACGSSYCWSWVLSAFKRSYPSGRSPPVDRRPPQSAHGG